MILFIHFLNIYGLATSLLIQVFIKKNLLCNINYVYMYINTGRTSTAKTINDIGTTNIYE